MLKVTKLRNEDKKKFDVAEVVSTDGKKSYGCGFEKEFGQHGWCRTFNGTTYVQLYIIGGERQYL